MSAYSETYRYGGYPEASKASEKDFLIDIYLRPEGGRHRTIKVQASVDTGANPLFISRSLAQELGYKPSRYQSADLYSIQGHKLDVVGQTPIEWSLEKGSEQLDDVFIVLDNMYYDILIGTDRWHDVKSKLPEHTLNQPNPIVQTLRPTTSNRANAITPVQRSWSSGAQASSSTSAANDYGEPVNSHAHSSAHTTRPSHHNPLPRTSSHSGASHTTPSSSSTATTSPSSWIWSAEHSDYYMVTYSDGTPVCIWAKQ